MRSAKRKTQNAKRKVQSAKCKVCGRGRELRIESFRVESGTACGRIYNVRVSERLRKGGTMAALAEAAALAQAAFEMEFPVVHVEHSLVLELPQGAAEGLGARA